MCAIAQNQVQSMAASMANSTMLGGAAVGSAPAGPGAKRVMGGVSTMLGGSGASGTTPVAGSGSGGVGNRFNPKTFAD